MTNFGIVYFSQYSFERVTTLILVALIVMFLCTQKPVRRHTRYLIMYFAFLLLYEAGHFFTYSVLHPAGSWGWYAVALGPVGLVGLLNCAYLYPRAFHERERRIAVGAGMLMTGGAFLEYVWRASQAPTVLTETGYAPAYQSGPVIIAAAVILIWTAVVFLRQSCAVSDRREKASARGMALIVIVQMLIMFPIALYTFFRSMPFVTVISALNAAHLILYSLFVFIYFAGTGQGVRLYQRLAGVFLVVVLAGTGIAGHTAFSQFETAYDARYKLRVRGIFQNASDMPEGKIPGDTDYICRITAQGLVPLWSREGACPDSLTRLVDFTPGRWRFSGSRQELDFADAQPMKRYLVQTGGRNHYQYIIRSATGSDYAVGFNYNAYRRRAHAVGLRLVLMALGGMCVVLLCIPALIRIENAWLVRKTGSPEDDSAGAPKAKHQPDQKKMNKAIEYISANYMYDISREGIAAHVQMSPGRFGIAFLQYTGKKFGEYLNDVRIDRACELLAQSRMSILDIAFASGFESISTFSRAFQKKTGTTAREYRERHAVTLSPGEE